MIFNYIHALRIKRTPKNGGRNFGPTGPLSNLTVQQVEVTGRRVNNMKAFGLFWLVIFLFFFVLFLLFVFLFFLFFAFCFFPSF